MIILIHSTNAYRIRLRKLLARLFEGASILIRAFSRQCPANMLVLTWEWLAHALCRVICWSVLHAAAGGYLAKQQSNPWGHGECFFFHSKFLGAKFDHFDPLNQCLGLGLRMLLARLFVGAFILSWHLAGCDRPWSVARAKNKASQPRQHFSQLSFGNFD